ncbi:hypothetical protein AAG906_005761 [Vitis piasezkii]
MVFELEAQHAMFGTSSETTMCFTFFSSLVRHHFQRNDFVNNYYWVPNSTRSRQFTLPNYVCYLISKLYKLGARRVFRVSELQQDQRRRFHGPFTWL